MKVSVCVITYNHEAFIGQCLNSIINQKVNFEFEIVIGEDGSSDRTRHRILEMSKLYSGVIKLLPDVGNSGMMANFVRSLGACKGQYIALCEGDDYWSDSKKLQKQVDFLEQNRDYVACYTDIQHFTEANGELVDVVQENIDTIAIKDLFEKNYVTTLTAVYRNILKEISTDFEKIPIGDWPLFVLLSQHGKIKRLPFIAGVYRIHDSNYFQANSYLSKKTKVTEATEFLYKHLQAESKPLAKEKLIDSYFLLSILNFKFGNYLEAVTYFKKLKDMIGNWTNIKIIRLWFMSIYYQIKNKYSSR